MKKAALLLLALFMVSISTEAQYRFPPGISKWLEKLNQHATAELQLHVSEAAINEWSKSDTMLFVLGESQYEGSGKIDNDMGEPQVIRRQSYRTKLSGEA